MVAIGVPKKWYTWTRVLRCRRLVEAQGEVQTWYFAFFKKYNNRVPWWLKIFIHDNFTHVLAFAQSGDYAVTIIDPIHSNICVHLHYHPFGMEIPMPASYIAADFHQNGGVVVEYRAKVTKSGTSHHITNFFPGCVTIAKSLIGVAVWAFTPFQFYKYLLGTGGYELTTSECDILHREFEKDLMKWACLAAENQNQDRKKSDLKQSDNVLKKKLPS